MILVLKAIVMYFSLYFFAKASWVLLLMILKHQRHVITCSSLAQTFVQRVCKLFRRGEDEDTSPESAQTMNCLHFIPSKEFNYENSKRKVLSLKLPSEPEDASADERKTFIMSQINFQGKCLVSSLGGILCYLQRSLARLTLSRSDMFISAINNLSLNDLMWVDEETFHGLQVFSPVTHPSLYKWSSNDSKDGISIFSLLNRCKSFLGTKFMRVMLTQPSKNMKTLLTRQQVVSFCLLSKNEQDVKILGDHLQDIKSVVSFVSRSTNGQATVSQWKTFYKTISSAVLIAEHCKSVEDDIDFFQEIGAAMNDSLHVIVMSINHMIDFEQSEIEGRLVIKSGISDDLDKVKEDHSNIPIMMSSVAELELTNLPEYIKYISMVYIPEIGYMVSIPYWDMNLTEEDLRKVPGLDFKFHANKVAYFKSARCYELDKNPGDLKVDMMEMESKIILQLIQYIQQNMEYLVKLINLLAELDCLLAFSFVARDYNFVCPELVDGRIIEIIKGRHPLQELCTMSFVPNDTVSNDEQGVVKLLTGPNASGKSIYLKQVALIAYLAHIGSFVPAESAKIGLLDHLHSRIQSVESMTLHLSSFMGDIRQMTMSLHNSSPTSLIIIDEFGKGTDECDGIGLLAACVQHLLERKDLCPHVMISTHFNSLPDLLTPSSLLSLQTMDYIITDNGEIVYLYKLKLGMAGSKFAIQVGTTQNVPKSITDRASQILEAMSHHTVIKADLSNRRIDNHRKKRNYFEKLALLDIDKVSLQEEENLTKEFNNLCELE
uniref:DNA mismatch repair proteins mutS family domain-containing protein n=1 Tax=Clastoptera arizonana TaxID=38151 RepID=A0A1B6CQJ5_9HEMI